MHVQEREADTMVGADVRLSLLGRQGVRHLRVAAAVALVALIALTAVAFATRPTTQDPARLVAAEAALTDAMRRDIALMLSWYAWLADPAFDPVNAQLVDASSARNQAWARYEDLAVGLPGEAALVDEYEILVEVGDEYASELLTRPDLADWAGDLAVRGAEVAAGLPEVGARLNLLGDLRALYADALAGNAEASHRGLADQYRTMTVATAVVAAILAGLFLALDRSARRRGRALGAFEQRADEAGRRALVDSQISRALEMTDTEDGAYRVLGDVMERESTGVHAELLVADSSQAHLRRSLHVGDDTTPFCHVPTPAACPAVRRGHTQAFAGPDEIDTCPHLRRQEGAGAATCVPFTVAGSTVGVLHLAFPGPIPETSVALAESAARKVGERVAMARAFARSEDQARTDPLTGLLNRRSFEDRAQPIADGGQPYTVVFCDLDHFKTLNDVHGHDAGDRALRLFARCLSDAVRPSDIASRHGGEEFVVVLPECGPDGAAAVIDRLRTNLARALDSGTVPRFSCSFGVAVGLPGDLATSIARSDAALLAAKDAGRARTVIWSSQLDVGDERAPDGDLHQVDGDTVADAVIPSGDEPDGEAGFDVGAAVGADLPTADR